VHVYAEDLTRSGYGGDVVVTQQQNYCYTNTTQPGHVFYPGTVVRCAYYNNDDIWISTIGEGDGEFKKMNEAMGPMIFTSIDASIIARMLAQGMGVIIPPS
jgi:hypothetical protein